MPTSTNERDGRRRNPLADELLLSISPKMPGSPFSTAPNVSTASTRISAPSTAPTGTNRSRGLRDSNCSEFLPMNTVKCSSHLDRTDEGTSTVT